MDWLLEVVTRPASLTVRLSIAFGLVAAGMALRGVWQIDPGAVPFVTLYPMVAIAGLLLGPVPGLVTLALCIGLSWFAILPPVYAFVVASWSDIAGLMIFSATGIVFLAGAAAFRLALAQVARQRDAYLAKSELRQILLRALRYCIGHYLRRLSTALRQQRVNAAGSVGCEILDDSIERLDALERLYRRLYAPEEFGEGSAGLFIEDVCRDLVAVAALPQVCCDVRADAVWLETDHRVSLGLMVAELLTDALERAPETPNTLEVFLRPAERGRVRLTVRDVGGLASSAEREAVCDHTPALTRALSRHLGGTVAAVAGDDGSVTVTVVLPARGSPAAAGGEF